VGLGNLNKKRKDSRHVVPHGEWFYPTVAVCEVADLICARNAKGLVLHLGLFKLLSESECEQIVFDERMARV